MNLAEIVDLALAEDVGTGDVTTELCAPAGLNASGRFIAREPLVVAGIAVLKHLYPSIQVKTDDGEALAAGDEIAVVHDTARTLLTRERVALNFLQHLSGIATLARKYAEAVEGTGCRVLDTRKTTPGLRMLEKMAARAGGITNHRIGLYDAVLIKNNHITAAGGVRAALQSAKSASVPVEIEVRTRAELEEALECHATAVLLDNLLPVEAAEWIELIDGRASVELSGGITLETVRAFAETGADFVSVGAITHSARSVDIHFRLELGDG
jgi:nicotinate-nucleotide pyrophosphorylase (carboxylating)